MAEKPKAYERLTRSRSYLNGTGSLWLGKDHLLQVTNVFAVENYRRWYLREIQAFVVQRTNGRMVRNIVFGILALIFVGSATAAALAAIETSSSDDRVGFWIVGGVVGFIGFGFLVLTLINTAMGPGCKVLIQTPHGLDRLSSPTRVQAFEKLSARLQPLIESAQTPVEKGQLQAVAASLDQPQIS
jgi:hypothetical protein